jgi:hypothetical protein
MRCVCTQVATITYCPSSTFPSMITQAGIPTEMYTMERLYVRWQGYGCFRCVAKKLVAHFILSGKVHQMGGLPSRFPCTTS